ncbi:MAG: glutathione S-transferase family protein [Rhodospirillales bacterium]|nr:glutathione S-transferase family protein [Rhodospirillales bacterium]
MYNLHYFPGNASFAPHALINEIGAPVELSLIDRAGGGHKQPAYLKLNPAGRIPAFVDGDLVLFEAAAICLHLCDKHPQANLAPALGTDARAHFYKWLMFMTNTIQPDVLIYHYTDRYTTDAAGVPGMKAGAEARLNAWYDLIADNMGPGPYLLGDTYSAVDVYLTMVCRWGRTMAKKPASRAKLKKLTDLVLARPAIQKTIAIEGIEGPFLG